MIANTMNTPVNANGNQNGNHTQNHVKVSGNTLVSFKIKNTNQVSQHNDPNEMDDVLLTTLTFSSLIIILLDLSNILYNFLIQLSILEFPIVIIISNTDTDVDFIILWFL